MVVVMVVVWLCLNLEEQKFCILILSLITIKPPFPSPSLSLSSSPHFHCLSPLRLYDATRVPLDTLALWRALMTPWQTAKHHLPPTPPPTTTAATTTSQQLHPNPGPTKAGSNTRAPGASWRQQGTAGSPWIWISFDWSSYSVASFFA